MVQHSATLVVLLLCAATLASAGGLYNQTVTDINGVPQVLSQFEGNVTLVVNVASE
jgi:hypothetical protein